MLRFNTTLFLFLIPSLVAELPRVHANAPAQSSPKDLSEILDDIRERFNAPGVAAAVTIDGLLIAVGSSGVRSLSTKEPVTIGDRSLVGSCGKTWTRFLMARLVDRGLLRWESTLAELLPDVAMRDEYRPVTVGDVLSHKAGLQTYTEIGPDRTPVLFQGNSKPARAQRAAFVAHLLMEAPSAPPKTRFNYSNAGYGLLGYIAERLTHKTFEELMREEVFAPLGMESAAVGNPRDVKTPPGWNGHMRQRGGFEVVEEPFPVLPALAPAGFMSCTIKEFARISGVLCDIEARRPTPFFSAKTAEFLPELRPGPGGEGQIFYGGEGTYTAAFVLWPSKSLSISVLSNAGDSDALCAAIIHAVQSAVASETSSRPGFKQAAGGDGPRYGFHIKIEADRWEVADVLPDSRAAKGGLKKGDVIHAVNGTPLSQLSEDDVLSTMHKSPLRLKVQRNGEPLEIVLTCQRAGKTGQ